MENPDPGWPGSKAHVYCRHCVECSRKQNLLKEKQHVSSKRKSYLTNPQGHYHSWGSQWPEFQRLKCSLQGSSSEVIQSYMMGEEMEKGKCFLITERWVNKRKQIHGRPSRWKSVQTLNIGGTDLRWKVCTGEMKRPASQRLPHPSWWQHTRESLGWVSRQKNGR